MSSIDLIFMALSFVPRYGAIVMDNINIDGSLGYTVLHNSSCQHAAPTYINLMNAAILRLATDERNMTIQTRNHPLPMTVSQKLQRHVCYLHRCFYVLIFLLASSSCFQSRFHQKLNCVLFSFSIIYMDCP